MAPNLPHLNQVLVTWELFTIESIVKKNFGWEGQENGVKFILSCLLCFAHLLCLLRDKFTCCGGLYFVGHRLLFIYFVYRQIIVSSKLPKKFSTNYCCTCNKTIECLIDSVMLTAFSAMIAYFSRASKLISGSAIFVFRAETCNQNLKHLFAVLNLILVRFNALRDSRNIRQIGLQ